MENTAPKRIPFDDSVEVRVPAFDAIAYIESQCALQLRTIVSDITFEGNWLEVKGWAQSLWVPIECCTMLLNGKEFSETTWIRDTSLEGHFGRLPASGNRRYICRQAFTNLDDIFHEGFAMISFVQGKTETQKTYRSTWYYPDIREVGPTPSEEQIWRVIGGQNAIQPYLMGGATYSADMTDICANNLVVLLESSGAFWIGVAAPAGLLGIWEDCSAQEFLG
jgi:hypothetical protein